MQKPFRQMQTTTLVRRHRWSRDDVGSAAGGGVSAAASIRVRHSQAEGRWRKAALKAKAVAALSAPVVEKKKTSPPNAAEQAASAACGSLETPENGRAGRYSWTPALARVRPHLTSDGNTATARLHAHGICGGK